MSIATDQELVEKLTEFLRGNEDARVLQGLAGTQVALGFAKKELADGHAAWDAVDVSDELRASGDRFFDECGDHLAMFHEKVGDIGKALGLVLGPRVLKALGESDLGIEKGDLRRLAVQIMAGNVHVGP